MRGQRNDERRAVVFWVGGTLAFVVALAVLSARWLGSYSQRPPQQGAAAMQPLQQFPSPRLQPQPRQDLQAVQSARRQLIRDYAWVDRGHGRCRVPIEVAMNLLLQDGFQLQR